MSAPKKGVRFAPLLESDMTDEQRRIAASIQKGRKSLQGPFNVMLRSPELADPLQQIGAYIRFRSPIDPKLKEFAILIVARFWNAEFEWYAHRLLALEAGLEPAKTNSILAGVRPVGLDKEEATIYRFVGQLLATGKVSDRAFDALKRLFGEQLVTDFIGLVGYYCTASFLLNVDRFPLPDGVAPMPTLDGPPFTDASD